MSNSDFSREFCDLINTFNCHFNAFKILRSALVVIINDYIAARYVWPIEKGLI